MPSTDDVINRFEKSDDHIEKTTAISACCKMFYFIQMSDNENTQFLAGKVRKVKGVECTRHRSQVLHSPHLSGLPPRAHLPCYVDMFVPQSASISVSILS